jgi:phenylalanyl-tRNA synthetase beta chain
LAIWSGLQSKFWKDDIRTLDFYDLKGNLETLFSQFFNINKELSWHPFTSKIFSPQSGVQIKIKDKVVGHLGIIAECVLQYFDLYDLQFSKNLMKIFFAEINLDQLLDLLSFKNHKYQIFSIYPSIHRDLALILDIDLPIQNILKDLSNLSLLVKKVVLTNIYQGKNLPVGKKSVVFNLELVSSKKTLNRQEADQEVSRIIKQLKKKHSFELR